MKARFQIAQPWLSTLARLFLAAVFIWAGWPKFLDSEGTVRSVRAFELLPEALVRPFAYGLPLIELALALVLVLGLATRIAALVTGAMMITFMFGIAWAWAHGLKIECGCFGNTGATVVDAVPGYIKDLFRDTGYLLAAAFLAYWPHSRVSVDGLLGLSTPQPVTSGTA
ncbi:MAG TPA: MauE/DoxX family redox-associated membrane protein [Kineosporiaceae bacterium]|nr:MauE/DoxX family redox-associated membrane protein [Kineosporiaceae bacterium]